MANRIQNDYRSHMQANSPDMDRLWNRIEQRIDAQQKPEQPVISQTSQPVITVKKNSFIKYAAAAACLIAVIAGTVIFVNSRNNKVNMSETTISSKSDSSSHHAAKSDESARSADVNENENVNRDNADPGEETNNDQINGKEIYDESKAEEKKEELSGDQKYAHRNNTKQAEAGPVQPKAEIDKLMQTETYKNADRLHKLELVEKFAKSLRENGIITAFEIIGSEKGDSIRITLPDSTIQEITIG